MALAFVPTSSALADGGTTIAGAPVVTPGQQLFGNTTTGAYEGGYSRSWWLLSLAAGDEVTVDWQGSQPAATSFAISLKLFAPGTSDFDVSSASPVKSSTPDAASGYRAQVIYKAPSAGILPLEFVASNFSGSLPAGGPYSFAATVRHGLTLGLPALTSLPQAGSVAVGVHAPDGTAIDGPGIAVTLQATIHNDSSSPWTSIGSGAPAAGSAVVGFSLPANFLGKRLDVRALATGAGYLDAATSAQTVDGPPLPVAPPPPVVPVAIERSITIKRVHGRYRGRVQATERSCQSGVAVSLLRKSTGAKVYGSTTTRADGSWTIRSRKLKGKIYAVVASNAINGFACQATASRYLRR